MTETRIVGGSLWMIGMRWTMRLIGLVSTIILARLLTPADFGIVAMAVIVVGLLDMLADAGVDLALLRNREAGKAHWDTAWTIRVMQGFIVAVLILLAIAPAASLFDDDRLRPVLAVLALRPVIDGFTNIGIVAFRRDLDFAREFRFGVLQKLGGFVVVVVLALVWRNYWALIVGRLAGGLISVAISYVMHSYRPRFTLKEFRSIWSFSQWLLVSRLGIFGNRNADKFVAGSLAGTATMGDYHVAKELGTMLANELIGPVRRAMFPNFAILIAEEKRFAQHAALMLSYLAALILPIQFGIGAVAPDFVSVVLGPRWTGITPLIEVLVLAGAASSLMLAVEFLLPVSNNTRTAALASGLELLVLVPALIFAMRAGGIESLPVARLAVAVLFIPVMFGLVARACSIPVLMLYGAIWRPLLAAATMAVSVRYLHGLLEWPAAARLTVTVISGVAIYPIVLALLWIASGRKAGIETDVYARLRKSAGI